MIAVEPAAAMATIAPRARSWQRREPRAQMIVWAAWLLAAALFVGCWQLITEKTIWAFVWDAPEQAVDLAVRMAPPQWSYIHVLARPIWDTINIATTVRIESECVVA